MTVKSTACHGQGLYWEVLYYVADKTTRFGVIRRCAAENCRKIIGDPSLDHHNKSLKEVLAMWNGTCLAVLIDHLIKRPGAPLRFVKGSMGLLVPENYAGEMKIQADLPQDDTPPF